MDKKAIHEFLKFFGAKCEPVSNMDWDLSQLQYAGVYFGMSGEDAFLRRHFKRRIHTGQPGTYVDLGAYKPAVISNTYLFYLMGWRGLAIDPNPATAEQWQLVRPQDAFESVAVGETEGTAYWWRSSPNAGMSVVTADHARPHGGFDETPVVTSVRRLETLFAKHFASRTIQFMSVDIEGAELSALKSNDWERWRPEAILLEVYRFDSMNPRAHAPVAYLLERGYCFSGLLAGNVLLTDGPIKSE